MSKARDPGQNRRSVGLCGRLVPRAQETGHREGRAGGRVTAKGTHPRPCAAPRGRRGAPASPAPVPSRIAAPPRGGETLSAQRVSSPPTHDSELCFYKPSHGKADLSAIWWKHCSSVFCRPDARSAWHLLPPLTYPLTSTGARWATMLWMVHRTDDRK